jgi:hypothetical protein
MIIIIITYHLGLILVKNYCFISFCTYITALGETVLGRSLSHAWVSLEYDLCSEIQHSNRHQTFSISKLKHLRCSLILLIEDTKLLSIPLKFTYGWGHLKVRGPFFPETIPTLASTISCTR